MPGNVARDAVEDENGLDGFWSKDIFPVMHFSEAWREALFYYRLENLSLRRRVNGWQGEMIGLGYSGVPGFFAPFT